MNSTKKNIRKTSGTLKKYKPGQLLTICKNVFRMNEFDKKEHTEDIWYS
uniref:Uncharacterized protein n=1 Tax=Podoviridae sp. ctG4L18 TaxID=2825234 RepID=A0A8S5UP95_9CAUD|nr:MAG TPA: hypothetical protein [Podoviridae sp. ctG4L18]